MCFSSFINAQVNAQVKNKMCTNVACVLLDKHVNVEKAKMCLVHAIGHLFITFYSICTYSEIVYSLGFGSVSTESYIEAI